MIKNLPHEAWDDKKVSGMAKGWKNPLDLAQDLCAYRRDRHWRLIYDIYSLIEGHSILDVGCGMGHLYALAKLDHSYIGLDSSESMIERAKWYFPKSRDKFMVGSAYDLEDCSISDTVVASGLILHLPDPEPVLQQLWSKTKICMVFSAWVGESEIIWKGRLPLYKRLLFIKPKGKYIIQRRDTLDSLYHILSKLDGVRNKIDMPFSNPYKGESNHLFKVWRKQ